MHFRLEPLLSASQVEELRLALLAEATPWRDGAETAGWHARGVKRNRQLDPGSALHQTLASALSGHLLHHPLLLAAALPVQLHNLRFSRCGVGEGYGRHVDNAYMAGGRSDLSFTLFLNDPDHYRGGDLVLEGRAAGGRGLDPEPGPQQRPAGTAVRARHRPPGPLPGAGKGRDLRPAHPQLHQPAADVGGVREMGVPGIEPG
jgi:hypothetical protein